MVQIEINRSDEHFRLKLWGHANYNPGNDIVCSAISALVYTAAGAFQNTDKPQKIDMVEGFSDIHVIAMDEEVKTISDVIIVGLLQIEKKFPNNLEIKLLDSI